MVVENGSCVCVCVFLFVVTWENEKKKGPYIFFAKSWHLSSWSNSRGLQLWLRDGPPSGVEWRRSVWWIITGGGMLRCFCCWEIVLKSSRIWVWRIGTLRISFPRKENKEVDVCVSISLTCNLRILVVWMEWDSMLRTFFEIPIKKRLQNLKRVLVHFNSHLRWNVYVCSWGMYTFDESISNTPCRGFIIHYIYHSSALSLSLPRRQK